MYKIEGGFFGGMSELVPDLYGEVVSWVDGELQIGVVCYLASIAGLKDDWGMAMSLAFGGGYEVGRFLNVWERSGGKSRGYLIWGLIRRDGVDFEELLKECVKRGIIELVEWLIDIGFGCPNGIIFAAERGHNDVVRVLLGAGANVHADNDCALRWAARDEHVKVVRLLLGGGADVHAKDDCAFRWAAHNGHNKIVRLLLEGGANMRSWNDYAIRWAVEEGHTKVMGMLLGAGANVYADNDCAFRMAAHDGHSKIVRVLLEVGVNVYAEADFALRWAAHNGHNKMVRLLLEVGANMHSWNDHAFRWAVEEGHTKVVRMLLGAGANMDANAFQWAADNGHIEVMRMLLGTGVVVVGDYTIQCSVNNIELVGLLLDINVDVHTDDALQWAVINRDIDLVRVLLKAGTNLHVLNDWYLHWSTIKRLTNAVCLLSKC